MRDVLVLVKTIFGGLAFPQVHAKFHEKEHNRLQRGDGAVPGSLGGDMFVEDSERSLRLVDSDELLRSL